MRARLSIAMCAWWVGWHTHEVTSATSAPSAWTIGFLLFFTASTVLWIVKPNGLRGSEDEDA